MPGEQEQAEPRREHERLEAAWAELDPSDLDEDTIMPLVVAEVKLVRREHALRAD